MIQFNCPKCGRVLAVRDELAGRAGRCSCGAKIDVPDLESTSSGAADQFTPLQPANIPQPAATPLIFDVRIEKYADITGTEIEIKKGKLTIDGETFVLSGKAPIPGRLYLR